MTATEPFSWRRFIQQAEGLLGASSHRISNAANLCALLYRELPDVEAFDGHIVCDAAARSEIVLPLFKRGRLIGVLDIDSNSLDRFNQEDESGLAELVQVYLASIE